jgi:hypothetical protein
MERFMLGQWLASAGVSCACDELHSGTRSRPRESRNKREEDARQVQGAAFVTQL